MILGDVRKMDNKGRILIPASLLEQLDLRDATEFNIYIKEGKLTLSPIERGRGDGQEIRKNKE